MGHPKRTTPVDAGQGLGRTINSMTIVRSVGREAPRLTRSAVSEGLVAGRGSLRDTAAPAAYLKLVASVEPGYNSPGRVRASDSAFDGTLPTENAATGCVQRPAIPPRLQPAASQPAENRGRIPGYR